MRTDFQQIIKSSVLVIVKKFSTVVENFLEIRKAVDESGE